MTANRQYPARKYSVAEYLLTLRTRADLTQAELAAQLGVHRRSVQKWESGETYPGAERLRDLIALFFKLNVFVPGKENAEAGELWELVRQQAPQQFPPPDAAWLASLQPAPTRPAPATETELAASTPGTGALPVGLTRFLGRTTELERISALLADPDCRLLTLVGPGGVGKTRLALELAALQRAATAIAFVPLTAVGTSQQLVAAIGSAIGLSFAGQSNPIGQLLNELRQHPHLLLLDGFEHLLSSADIVRDILAVAPGVRIIITSQHRLNLLAEWLFDVSGLDYPQHDERDLQLLTAERFAGYGAVQLFISRVRQVQPDLVLGEADLRTIARICRDVAGLPLAIELAAAQVRVLPLTVIEREISGSISTPTLVALDMPARHRSMSAVFEYSWSLLAEPERALLARLAVFRAGCTLDAAGQVAGATRSSLATLVDKSLLLQEVSQALGASRFGLAAPLRELALEKLAERGEEEALRRAHATFYLTVAERSAAAWNGPGAGAAIKVLEREYDNVRAALDWALERGETTLGLQLAGALTPFWRSRVYLSEGHVWLRQFLAEADQASDRTTLEARLRAMQGAAWLAADQNDFAHAERLFESSMALSRELAGADSETGSLLNAALQARAAGQYGRATVLLEDMLALLRGRGDQGSAASGGLGLALYDLGLVLREQGEYDHATELLEECVALHRQIGDRQGEAQGMLALGDVALDQGYVAATISYSEASLAVFRKLGTQWATGFALNNLAQAALQQGDAERAASLIAESVELFRRQSALASLSEVLITQGRVWRIKGAVESAANVLVEALQLAANAGPRLMQAAAMEELAIITAIPPGARMAAKLLGAAAALRERMGTPVRPADRPALERATASVRAALGARTFAAHMAAAADLTLDAILRDLRGVDLSVAANRSAATPGTPGPRLDWGDAPATPDFYGREAEMDQLNAWISDERCRVVSILGMGGIGKSALAANIMSRVAGRFTVVIWRSLRDLPGFEALLDDLLRVHAPLEPSDTQSHTEQRLGILLDQMRAERVLIVLDNLESVLERGDNSGQLRPGYEGLGRFLSRAATIEHQSCVLLTSREKPATLTTLEGADSRVRLLRLDRLPAAACAQLLAGRNLNGDARQIAQLAEAYGGNPLALKIIAQTIIELFGGDIKLFMAEGVVIFGGVRELLDQQFTRLSPLEQSILLWLAIMREPTTMDTLVRVQVRPVARFRMLEALQALRHRSLIESGQRAGSFTLQSVVLEYLTARLVAEATAELESGHLVRLVAHGLTLAGSSDYVRETQERLLVAPVLAALQSGSEQLIALLARFREHDVLAQGYGPANLVALLRVARGELRGIDLSRLTLRNVYLQGVEMQDASLENALIHDGAFSETFPEVTAAIYSDNGQYCVVFTNYGQIHVWETGGGTWRRLWHSLDAGVTRGTISPDTTLLAGGDWDGAVYLWEIASGKPIWTTARNTEIGMITDMAFSPDGLVIACSNDNPGVRLLDRANGVMIAVLPLPSRAPALQWSPDGRTLAASDTFGAIHMWRIAEGELPVQLYTLNGHTAVASGLAFSPDGKTLASGSWDGTVRFWDVVTGQLRETIDGRNERVSRIAWSYDGRTIAFGGTSSVIWLWDVNSATYRKGLHGHRAAIARRLSFTLDNRTVFSAAADGSLRLWDVNNGQCTRHLQGYSPFLYDLAWSPEGSKLLSSGNDRTLTIYSLAGERHYRTVRVADTINFGVSWSPDGRTFASSDHRYMIRQWDVESGTLLKKVQAPQDQANYLHHDVTWSPDGRLLACGTFAFGVLVFDMEAGALVFPPQPFPVDLCSRIGWSPDGRLLAGGAYNGVMYIWDAQTGVALRQFDGHKFRVSWAEWSPDGQQIASLGWTQDGTELILWDGKSGQQLQKFFCAELSHAAIVWRSDEGLLLGTTNHLVRCYSIASGALLWESPPQEVMLDGLKASNDGTLLACRSEDGSVSVWDTRSGALLQTLHRDRPYERLNIRHIRGLTVAQQRSLVALGAITDPQFPHLDH